MARQAKLGNFREKETHEAIEDKEVQGPYELPEGWKWVKLKEVLKSKPQYGFTAKAVNEPIGPKFLRITDIQNGKVIWEEVPYCKVSNEEISKYRLNKGDILFARSGATTGKTYLVEAYPENAIFASYLIRIKVKEGIVRPDFLFSFFQSPQYWTQIVPIGGAQPNMNARKLLEIFIPLPPLEEQERIVSRLNELVNRADEAKRLRRQAREEAEKIMQAALNKVFSRAEEEGWEWVKLENCCEINPSSNEIRHLSDDTKVTFVPMTAVSEVTGRIEKPEVRLLGEVRKGYTYFREGDVLFAKITPCMENGKSAIARNLINSIGFGSTEFHVLRPLKGKVISEWIYYYVRQKSFREEAARNMTGSVGQQRVPVQFMKIVKIPLPSIDEQRKLAAYLNKMVEEIEILKMIQQKTEEELEKLVPAILDKAFKGEL